jgi:glutamine amidotransferase
LAIETFLLEIESSNWRSVYCALSRADVEVSVISVTDIGSLARNSILILPGVGNIKYLSAEFSKAYCLSALAEHLKENNIGIIGICLGFQFLCHSSTEDGSSPCLSMLDLCVETLSHPPKPSVGWKYLTSHSKNKLAEPLSSSLDGGCFYFTHSYGIKKFPCSSENLNIYLYEGNETGIVVAATISPRIIGLQFHPEKSGSFGAEVLKSAVQYLKV